MKRIMLLGAVLTILLLAGCSSAPKVGELFDGETNAFEGVTMAVKEGTVTRGGLTLEITNTADKEIDSGNAQDFALQILQEDGWHWLERKQDLANTAEAFGYLKGEAVEQPISWVQVYGGLPKGQYRVVKAFFDWQAPGDFDRFLLTAEFEIQ